VSFWFLGAYGTDMRGSAPGISVLTSRTDGSLELVAGAGVALASPAFLAADGETVYAALEGDGKVVALDRNGTVLTVRSTGESGGTWPCHIGVYGQSVVVANYFEGNVGVLDASLAETRSLPGVGSGPHAAQDGPHAHSSIEVVPGTVLVADLGADRLRVFALPDFVEQAAVELPAGFAPRDLLLHPSGVLYVLGEHSRQVLVCRWVDGALDILETVDLPGALPTDQSAALGLGDGFLYAGLRGSNQIAVLSVGANGTGLAPVASVASEGNWPRHLVVDDGVLHVANQESGDIASFALGADGIPVLIAPPTPVPSPTYLLRAK
jgi:6-phosphogluconolactonase